MANIEGTAFATTEEELQKAIDLQNSEADKPDFDFDSRFDFDSDVGTHPHRLVVAAIGISCPSDIDYMHNTSMAFHIKMETYSGELGIKQQKFIDDCHFCGLNTSRESKREKIRCYSSNSYRQ